MSKYNLEIQNGKIGENGLAEVAGWVKCYLSHPVTREYMGATMENIMFDVSLSSGAYLDKPKLPTSKNKAVIRNQSGTEWETVDDFRGSIAYDILTKQSVTIDFIGALPEALTMIKPNGEFDRWDGEKWITDSVAVKSAQVSTAKQQMLRLSQEAEVRITQLERKVRLEMANEEDKALLRAWEIYTVRMNDVNPELAPDIEWPQKPE